MAKKGSAHKIPGPPAPFQMPPANGRGCEIIFGANADAQAVLMQFNVTTDKLVFTVEQAHEVADQLIKHAEMARGSKKPS